MVFLIVLFVSISLFYAGLVIYFARKTVSSLILNGFKSTYFNNELDNLKGCFLSLAFSVGLFFLTLYLF